MNSRDDVLAAALRVLNRDPAASMAVIASAAGISRATVHRYFDSREALLVELGTRSLDRWEQRLDTLDVESVAASADPALILETLEVLILGYVDDGDDFGFALTDQVILANAALERRTQRLADRETALLRAAQEAGVLRADLPPSWFGHAIYGLLVAAREALRVGDVARRDAGRLVLSTLQQGVTA
ncbi:TetR/AcrR family transcriptional regulator [Nocardioides sp. SYSU D00065]|uniref:TetR/AcrR family transcriptional regulator n=1 Tax=Nocardioides sp. SYSU D00065 TaxID=2817378 RepID=UPI001B32DB54|nr:TetR/AcrR family transcriptional regulator [Nocardioides sp. SYSU D00065]